MFVHHFDPYQKLGPFHLEVQLYTPFRTIVHDFLTRKEMVWMMEYSRPKLSAARRVSDSSKLYTKANLRQGEGKKGKTVAKAIQVWFRGIQYNETEGYKQINKIPEPLMYAPLPLKDRYSFHVINEVVFQVDLNILFHC